MNDLIDRNQLYHDMTMKRLELHEKGLSWNEFCRGFGFAMEFVKEAPSAEPERTAKVKLQDICWEDIRHYKEGMCASCGRSVYNHAKYCDECGCRLEWDE